MANAGRKEPFRYVMNQPIECQLTASSTRESVGAPAEAEGVLLDLSPSGCKVRTPLNIRFSAGDTRLRVSFRLNEQPIELEGSVRWGWMFGLGQYQYGIRFELDEVTEALLLSELELWSLSPGDND